jgi:hypothetical protein
MSQTNYEGTDEQDLNEDHISVIPLVLFIVFVSAFAIVGSVVAGSYWTI